MTTQEKQVMLAFLQEQQHYNESLTAFCQYLCNITTTPSDTVPSASADGPSTTDPSPI